jgi:hypothetical protein
MFRIGEEVEPSVFSALIKHLQDKPLEINKYRKASGLGRSQCFGIVKQRQGTYNGSRQNFARMDLYKELLQIAQTILPTGFLFDGIQLNDNYQTSAHKDKGNRDESAIVAFGDYCGGELVVEDTPISINHRVIYFNGSLYTHFTAPYIGQRYSIVFFKVKDIFTEIPRYSFNDKYLVETMSGIVRWYTKKGYNIWSSDDILRPRKSRHPTLSECRA